MAGCFTHNTRITLILLILIFGCVLSSHDPQPTHSRQPPVDDRGLAEVLTSPNKTPELTLPRLGTLRALCSPLPPPFHTPRNRIAPHERGSLAWRGGNQLHLHREHTFGMGEHICVSD